MSQREIAVLLGISRPTLKSHFARELELGPIKAKARVLQALFTLATSGRDTTATIFWLRTWLSVPGTLGKNSGRRHASSRRRGARMRSTTSGLVSSEPPCTDSASFHRDNALAILYSR